MYYSVWWWQLVESEVGNFQQYCCFIVFSVALLFVHSHSGGLKIFRGCSSLVGESCVCRCVVYVGVFITLQKAAVSFIVSVHLHGITQLHWMNFGEIRYLRVQKSVEKIKIQV